MASDITRRTFDPKKRYAGVVKQQGRVTLDADDNEALAISLEDERLNNLHTIGPSGTPDDGFRISHAEEGLDDESEPNGRIDFTISGGTIYVGGLRYDSEVQTFQDQTGWHEHHTESWPTIPSAGDTRIDLVYLLLWQQDVTASEDQELIEPALVDIDTSTRVRTMGQICVMATDAEDCESAWAEVGTEWRLTTSEERAKFRETAEITTDARLRVSFNCTEIDQEGDLCADHAREGYLYADNQAIRVQIHDTDTLLWGFDNASGFYRISLSGTTVTFETLPRDEVHYPRVGQMVEVLRWTDELPNEGKIAALTGHLSTVASPSYDSETKTFELDDPCPSEWEDDEVLYLRVWEEQLPLVSDTEVALGTTGVCITLSGNQFREGDYWTIGVRPETPQEVYPKSLTDGEPPHGIRRFACPLALIHWSGPEDPEIDTSCLEPFNNLVELTRVRQGTCCRVTVGDGGMYDDIAEAVRNLPEHGGEVCILPGHYYLEEPVILESNKITITGCKRRTYVFVQAPDLSAFIIRGDDITLLDLSIITHAQQGAISISNAERCCIEGNRIRNEGDSLGLTGIYSEECSDIKIKDNYIFVDNRLGDCVAISSGGTDITIENNTCIGGGIQFRGGSIRVLVQHNNIVDAYGNGITLGSISDNEDTEGELSDITISSNQIRGARINGISVAKFFNLDENSQLIITDHLQIVENEITDCIRDPDPNDPALPNYAAYGGIAIASGESILIRGNRIENNGTDRKEPVCGVFILLSEGLEIADNHILGNGELEPGSEKDKGFHGGIVLPYAGPGMYPPPLSDGEEATIGLPTAKIHDNVVVAPWGQAILLQAIGPVTVSNNSFLSEGVPENQEEPIRYGGTVLIVNLGRSTLFDQIGTFRTKEFTKETYSNQPESVVNISGSFGWDSSAETSEWTEADETSGLVDGRVLFEGNQVTQMSRISHQNFSEKDIIGRLELFIQASTLIITMDDVCFTNNQLSCEKLQYPILANGLVLAATSRATGNLFKEGRLYEEYPPIGGGLFSYLSWAIMNIAALNQGKYCFLVEGISGKVVRDPNHALPDKSCQKLFAMLLNTQ